MVVFSLVTDTLSVTPAPHGMLSQTGLRHPTELGWKSRQRRGWMITSTQEQIPAFRWCSHQSYGSKFGRKRYVAGQSPGSRQRYEPYGSYQRREKTKDKQENLECSPLGEPK